MRRNNTHHPRQAKQIARMKYAERQIEKFFKWSWDVKGKIKYKDIKQLQDKYNIECYAESRTRR
jgi:hypothetical protein